MGMNLLAARATVRSWLRSNGYDVTLYSDFMIDTALSACGDELARETTLLQRVDTITFTSGDNRVSGLPTNFRPDRLLKAYLSSANVHVDFSVPASPYYAVGQPSSPLLNFRNAVLNLKPYTELLNALYATNNFSGQPQDLAFEKRDGTGICFPVPDDTYTCSLVWNDLFGTWTKGTQGAWSSTNNYQIGDVVSSGGHTYQALIANLNVAVGTSSTWLDLGVNSLTAPASVTFNVVDDYLLPVLMCGTPSKIQYNEPTNAFAAAAKAQWEQFVVEMAGKGDLGESYLERTPAARCGIGVGYEETITGIGV